MPSSSALLADEAVVLRQSARRQRATLRRDALLMTA
jgi:hypothetical protein